MKYVDEFRVPEVARRYSEAIARSVTRPWTIMEVCGGQTHAIMRFGLDRLLPPEIELVHGPGCPVCVTPIEIIETALAIAARPDVMFCTFGDMIRVPGRKDDLRAVKARGGDVRVVYSPLDAVALARKNPEKEVVFFAVGFETTAPTIAVSVMRAQSEGLTNFSVLVSHVLVPPAMEAILSSSGNRVQSFLAAGHVCTVMGVGEYEDLLQRFRVPIVVTGFEPLDILQGVLMCVRQLEEGRAEVENQYLRAVRSDGNEAARSAIREVFEVVPRQWRGIGVIPQSGLGFRRRFHGFDAERRFGVVSAAEDEDSPCIAGEVLKGRRRPTDCTAFGVACTPETPLGAPMVSSEGACAAYLMYRGVAAERPPR